LKSRGVPQPLIELLRSCLAIDPSERPASARELMRAIETCRAQIVRPPRNRKVAFAAFSCITVAAAVATFLLSRQAANKKAASLFELNLSAEKPTENGQAYLLYLRGVQAEASSIDFEPPLKLYRQAVALDPHFALAIARCSIMASNLVQERDGDEALEAEAKSSADQVQHLAPNLPEAYVALANYWLMCKSDGDRALAEIERAAELAPDSAELDLTAAFVYKRQNRFRERVAALRRAEVLEPQNIRVRAVLVRTYRWVRDWPDATEALDRRVVVTTGKPSWSGVTSAWSRANDEFRRTSDINALKQGLAQEEGQTAPDTPADRLDYERFEIAMFERNYISAAQFLGTISPEVFERSGDRFGETGPHAKPFYEALLAVASNTTEKEERLERVEKAIRSVLQHAHDIDRGFASADLAIIQALAGQKDEAIRTARRAVEDLPGSSSIVEINDVSSALALVYAQTGETDKALDLIEHLLTAPCQVQRGAVYNMTLTDLKWRWIWDPLRSNPRFQKLLAGAEPRTIY
jgi:tetratricopeptide (TPR) repeat protein